MGQHWVAVNLDKREFVHPHRLGAGAKLWEQLANRPGTAAALVILCAAQREVRGNGDLDLEGPDGYEEIANRTIGRWAGDRIALVGDYAKDDDLAPEHEARSIWELCVAAEYEEDVDSGDGSEVVSYIDVTDDVCAVIAHELNGQFIDHGGFRSWVPKEQSPAPLA